MLDSVSSVHRCTSFGEICRRVDQLVRAYESPSVEGRNKRQGLSSGTAYTLCSTLLNDKSDGMYSVIPKLNVACVFIMII